MIIFRSIVLMGLSLDKTLMLVSLSALVKAQSATAAILCDKFQQATTASGRYTFLTAQWGLDYSGQQCMTVRTLSWIFLAGAAPLGH